jgi:hypothetical protein
MSYSTFCSMISLYREIYISSLYKIRIIYRYLLTKYNMSIVLQLIDAAVHFEHVQAMTCDFKLVSVERSMDLCQRGYTSAGDTFNCRHQ